MPLFIRIDAHDDFLEKGLTIEEVIDFCNIAKEHGVDVLDVSRGNILTAATIYEVPPIDVPQGSILKCEPYSKRNQHVDHWRWSNQS